MPCYATVPLAVTRRETYTYRSETPLRRGEVVRIRYAGRERTGVIWNSADADPRAVEVSDRTGERLPEWQLRFAEELAERFLAPLGQTLRLFLPEWRGGGCAPERTNPGESRLSLLASTDPWPEYAETLSKARGQCLLLVPEARLVRDRIPDAIPFTATMPITARREAWKRVSSDPRAVVVGTRSALFLPWCSLSTMIVDQEDELGYVNDRTPRYHAREAALLLAARQGASLLLSSVAPGLRAWAAAGQPALTEPELVHPGVVGIRNVSGRDVLPYGLAERIRETDGEVLVHTTIRHVGEIRDALKQAAPGARVRVAGQPALFRDRRYALAVALDFDALLSRPGYAVTERAVSLARKLAARVVPGGRLLIYTAHPDHPALTAAAGAYRAFLKAELAERRALRLPPAGPLVRIETTTADEPKVLEQLETLGVPERSAKSTRSGDRATILVKWDPPTLRPLITPERRISVDY